ncbi:MULTISPECIES: hypothetical protein [Rhizobium]|uniref:hypothetical protein n=1 Tax=Rhizobium TaxID=379 RepID=UPI00197FA992|nr:hypothetical protein [Rhizobium leguminosarum]UFW82035.1 hypothetical protein RlegSU303_29435 [Rhizobium leguminosarum bv. viciae]
MKERKPALVATERLKELLAERGLKVTFSGMDRRLQRNERITKASLELFMVGSEAQ